MKTKTKKVLKMALCLCLVAAVAAGSAYAMLTYKSSKTNTFVIGRVSAELTEPGYVDNQTMVPGKSISKQPTLTIKSGSAKSFGYMTVTVPEVSNDGSTWTDLFTYSLDDNWKEFKTATENTTNRTKTHYLVYGSATAPTQVDPTSAAQSISPFKTVTMISTVTSESQVMVSGTAKKLSELSTSPTNQIVVTAYAIQAEGLSKSSSTDIWTSYLASLT